MAHFDFNRFYRYEELTTALHAAAAARPNLMRLHSIGKSHEGRDIWLATVTRFATGEPQDKPAFWVDGNIHSIEVSASAANLYWLNALLEGDGTDADTTRALDTRTFYICPRVNPDGAEWALADFPKYVRSSTRRYPEAIDGMADVVEGYEPQDINGDGRILRVRIPDANGHWKCHASDPRVMVRRDPAEAGGQYYRVLPEGRMAKPEHFDGTRIRVNKPLEGIDLNRNFPAEWRQEFEQMGASNFAASEPEVRAVVQFFMEHRNITSAISFHTFSGVLLRPSGTHADKDMTPEDLWVYKAVGKKGEALTGYPAIGVYEEFRYHPKEVITGTFDWVYDHLGIYTWTVEIWSPMREAGIEKYAYIDWFRDHPEEDDLKLMAWNDQALGGKAFVDWQPFDHPDFGAVELGGWDTVHFISNVPKDRLEQEVAKFPKWLMHQALISPQLALKSTKVEALGADLWRLSIALQNTGYLPTTVSKRAADRKQVTPLMAQLELPEGVTVVNTAGNSNASFSALPRVELGQLTGWSHKQTGTSFWPDSEPTSDIAVAQWVLKGPVGSVVPFVARAARAGAVRGSVTLA